MAIKAEVMTEYGEERELYIRLNSVSSSNHGIESEALFRGFASKEAFNDGKRYMFEERVMFNADVSLPLWNQAYSVLKEKYPNHDDV